MGFRKTI